MPSFTSFNDRLPDPTFDVNDAGAQVTPGTGKKAEGFASVTVRSKKDIQVSRTNSGRGISRGMGAHVWEIDINYHPMPRESFDIVQAFLDARDARLHPFYVVLPQHSKPKDPKFQDLVLNYTVKTWLKAEAGDSYFVIDANDGSRSMNTSYGLPSPGDYFNVNDLTDLNHKKAYRITRVETSIDYNSSIGPVNIGQVRIHVTPPLVREVPADTPLIFTNPAFRVIAKGDVFEYNLNTDNLYQFQLQLEEILP